LNAVYPEYVPKVEKNTREGITRKGRVPMKYWKDIENQRQFMNSVGREIGVKDVWPCSTPYSF